MLSSFHERVARLIAEVVEGEGFALAGGGALVSRGDVDRRTEDLDFFGLLPEAVDRVVPLVKARLEVAERPVR